MIRAKVVKIARHSLKKVLQAFRNLKIKL
jgi:hypothetical protein